MKIIKQALKVLAVLAGISAAIVLGFAYRLGYLDRCDHRTFTIHIYRTDGLSTTTHLYTEEGAYVYPPQQWGQSLTFSTPFPVTKGEFIDQCLNLNVHPVDTHQYDANY